MTQNHCLTAACARAAQQLAFRADLLTLQAGLGGAYADCVDRGISAAAATSRDLARWAETIAATGVAAARQEESGMVSTPTGDRSPSDVHVPGV